MFLTICIFLVIHSINLSGGDDAAKRGTSVAMPVNDLADSLVSLLQGSRSDNRRIRGLRLKLARINSYVLINNQYSDSLLNHTRRCNLTETKFFNALQERDEFLVGKESKHLYLQIKEQIERDDLLRILAKRGRARVKITARRMMKGQLLKRRRVQRLDEMARKYLDEAVHDEHNFTTTYSPYWDPVPELETRIDARNGRRIFQGERALISNYPFMATVHVMGGFVCGAVIYSRQLLLTAASCLQLMHNNRFFRENPNSLAVRIGSNHSRFSGELIPALEVFFHPSYNPKTLYNNIALIRLQRQLKMNYHRIPKAIAISHNEGSVSTNSQVLVLGWGVVKTDQVLSLEPKYLQRKVLPVYPNKFCTEIYGKKYITDKVFCAGTMSTGEGACNHDGGGPAVLDGVLVGLISFGPRRCGFHAPTVFTLVGAYADWIETIESALPAAYTGRKATTQAMIHPFVKFYIKTTTPANKLPFNILRNVLKEGRIDTKTPRSSNIMNLPINQGKVNTEDSKINVNYDSLFLANIHATKKTQERTAMSIKSANQKSKSISNDERIRQLVKQLGITEAISYTDRPTEAIMVAGDNMQRTIGPDLMVPLDSYSYEDDDIDETMAAQKLNKAETKPYYTKSTPVPVLEGKIQRMQSKDYYYPVKNENLYSVPVPMDIKQTESDAEKEEILKTHLKVNESTILPTSIKENFITERPSYDDYMSIPIAGNYLQDDDRSSQLKQFREHSVSIQPENNVNYQADAEDITEANLLEVKPVGKAGFNQYEDIENTTFSNTGGAPKDGKVNQADLRLEGNKNALPQYEETNEEIKQQVTSQPTSQSATPYGLSSQNLDKLGDKAVDSLKSVKFEVIIRDKNTTEAVSTVDDSSDDAQVDPIVNSDELVEQPEMAELLDSLLTTEATNTNVLENQDSDKDTDNVNDAADTKEMTGGNQMYAASD